MTELTDKQALEAFEGIQSLSEGQGICKGYGEATYFLPHTRAVAPGHIYSLEGLAEMRISGFCEYHFDKLTDEDWTEPDI